MSRAVNEENDADEDANADESKVVVRHLRGTSNSLQPLSGGERAPELLLGRKSTDGAMGLTEHCYWHRRWFGEA